MAVGEGQGAYQIVRGIEASGQYIEAPSYMFPYYSTSGIPITYQDVGSSARNVETGGYFARPAGEGERFAEAKALALKYQPIGVLYEQQTAAETRNILQEQKTLSEQQALQHGFGGVFPTEYSQRMAAAPVGSYIPTESQYEKTKYLASETAQWSSAEEFQKKASEYGKFAGFAKVSEFKGTIVSPPSYQPPSQTIPSPFQLGGVGLGGIYQAFEERRLQQTSLPSYRFGRSESEFAVLPKYGQTYPKEIAEGLQAERTGRVYTSLLPEGMGLSNLSIGFYKGARNISESIRDKEFTGKTEPSLFSAAFPQFAALPYVRESVARLPEFIGTIPGTVEIFGKTAISKPLSLPSMIAYGGVAVATGVGKQAVSEPAQLLSDLFVTTGAFKLAGRTATGITEPIRFMGKKYVPAESIIEPQVLSGAERFPLAPRGTTGAQLVREFELGKFRMPGTEGKIGGWHATPEAFAKTTLTQPGTSEGLGLYIAPSTSPHFWKIGGGQLKLFGWGEAPTSPTGIWLETAGIKRSPGATRYNIELQNMFLTQKAPKGTGFISAAFEKGIKPEKEAIIPPETQITRVSNQFYTKYMGKRVPLMEYTAVQPKEPIIDIYKIKGIGTIGRTKSGIVNLGVPAAMYSMGKGKPQKEETFGELAQRQIKISSEYSRYREPLFTPSSIVSSVRSSYRPASMSSISLKSSYARPSASSPGRYAASSIYGGISSQIYPSTTSNIYSSGRSTYISKTGYPGKTTYPGTTTYPGYPHTPTPPFTIITTLTKPPKKGFDLFPSMRTGRKKRAAFKFPELTRVATPKQIMRGFKL